MKCLESSFLYCLWVDPLPGAALFFFPPLLSSCIFAQHLCKQQHWIWLCLLLSGTKYGGQVRFNDGGEQFVLWMHWSPRLAHCLSEQFLVTQSCPTLCNPVDCSTPGFPVHHQLLELAQSHVHWVSDAIQPCHPVVPFSSCPQSFPASGSFPVSQLFTWGGQSIGASASVLPMNTQDWFPLGWTGWISLQSKGLSRVFSNTTVQKHQFFST